MTIGTKAHGIDADARPVPMWKSIDRYDQIGTGYRCIAKSFVLLEYSKAHGAQRERRIFEKGLSAACLRRLGIRQAIEEPVSPKSPGSSFHKQKQGQQQQAIDGE